MIEVDRVADEHVDHAEGIVRIPKLEHEHIAVAEPVFALDRIGKILDGDRNPRLHAERCQHTHGPQGVTSVQIDQHVDVFRAQESAG